MKQRPPQAEPRPSYGVIRADAMYPLPSLKSSLRWGDKTIAQAQRDGLTVYRYAKWGYCLGADVISFLQRVGNEPAASGEGAGDA